MLRNIFAALILTAATAAAQAPLPELRIEPTTGGSFLYVKNVATQPLTAYLIELVDYPGSRYSLLTDEVGREPIAPGTEKKIRVNNMTVGAVPDYVKIRAAIYADGSTAGIPEKVTQIVNLRRQLLATTREQIAKQPAGPDLADLKAKEKALLESKPRLQ
jgi:hypothetical protein